MARERRAQITQIMNLILLAPDIQEEILILPRVASGVNPVHLRKVQAVTLAFSWTAQRRMWRLVATRSPS